ncbi:MAG TPA: precorrin-6A reductase, partial [Syntrophales bacterium]|nr:precorrin-6A reductase [Syntrophales bacterium]
MILLLGGTGDTAPLALGLAEAGYKVLVSTATDIPLDVGAHANIQRRTGRLDEEGMTRLVRDRGIKAIVDSTHPYATIARKTARRVTDRTDVPYFTLIRPTVITEGQGIVLAGSHEEAAGLACATGRPVFLTTGVKNLEPYAKEARRTGIKLIVRVLPERASFEACRNAGIDEEFIITKRGPFSVEDNRSVMKRYGIGVIVTKDSGPSGGTPEKLEAACIEGCLVVVVKRPDRPVHDAFEKHADLLAAVIARIPI